MFISSLQSIFISCLHYRYLPSNHYYLGSSNGQIALWDSRFTSHPVHYLEGHTAAICCGDWSPHCQSKIVTGGDDMKVIVWDLLKVETSVGHKE